MPQVKCKRRWLYRELTRATVGAFLGVKVNSLIIEPEGSIILDCAVEPPPGKLSQFKAQLAEWDNT